jgi:hypothetical protein
MDMLASDRVIYPFGQQKPVAQAMSDHAAWLGGYGTLKYARSINVWDV